MKAVRFHEYGGPDVLVIEDVDLPRPGAGQIRITVKAAGIHTIGAATAPKHAYLPPRKS
jgi:NADPH:quinone reductase-like Zn-dependent oxidoreductase